MECYERYEESKITSTILPRKLIIKQPMLSMISLQVSVRNSQLPKSSKTFETYINKVNVIMDSKPLSINELKDAFFSLKINKSSGVEDVSFNIIKKYFGVFRKKQYSL